MPPPTPGSPAGPSPRKRRRKREDPQSCVTNSEVSYLLTNTMNTLNDSSKLERHL